MPGFFVLEIQRSLARQGDFAKNTAPIEVQLNNLKWNRLIFGIERACEAERTAVRIEFVIRD